MGVEKSSRDARPSGRPLALTALSALFSLSLCAYCFYSGYYIIVQNLLYIPIIIACTYFTKRGFIFSIIISLVYLMMLFLFARDQAISMGGLVRVLVFVSIGATVTYITVRNQAVELLHESEERFRNAFEHSAIGMALVSPEGKWLKVNRRVCDILGYTEDELMTKTFQDITYPDDLNTDLDFVRRMLVREIDTYQMEKRYFHKEGHIVWAFLAVSLVWKKNGAPLHFISQIKDITDRKKAEEVLRISEERFRTLVQHTPVMIDGFDGAGRCVLWNEKCRQVFGWTMEEVNQHEDPLLLFYPDPAVREHVKKTVTLEPEGRFTEFHPVTKDGRTLVTMWANFSIADGTVINVGYDITAHRQVENALAVTVQRLRLANKATNDVIWDWDVVTDTQQWNEAGTVVFGWTEIVERPVSAHWWVERVHPDDRQRIHESFFAVVNNPKLDSWRDEYRFRKADGAYADVLDRGFVLRDEQGKAIRMVGAMQNITERKSAEKLLRESEERYALALRGAHDGVWDWDLRTDAVRYSPQWKAMLGYSEEEIRDELSEWQRLVHPEDSAHALAAVDDFLSGRTSALTVEMRMRHKEGHWLPVLSRGSLIRDEDGRPIRMVGTHMDLTERNRAKDELLQLKKSESLGRMAGAIAHRYNNFMGVVLGNLELAVDSSSEPAEATSMIAIAAKAAQQAAELSHLMLAYLGHETGMRKSLDLSALCREALSAPSYCPPENVRVNAMLPSQGPIIQGDMAHLKQVLSVLLQNAHEAIGEAGGDISVTIADVPVTEIPSAGIFPVNWEPQQERYACLSVADTGCGFFPETMENLFDPFFSSKFTGRGLGLPVALGIVKAHGGAFAVNSQPGEGAVFRVFLPLAPVAPWNPTAPAPVAPAFVGGVILVVDAEPMMRNLGCKMLQSAGYEAIGAENGAEAIEIVRQRKEEIRCVLCDLTMPKMNGWETLTALRQIHPELPVVLCSGYDETTIMSQVHEEQPQAFLPKPYQMTTLITVLGKALGKNTGA